LIVHQSDQRRDNEGCASASDCWELIAKAFAGAGRHYEQHVAPIGRGTAHCFLIDAEGREAERAVQEPG
jgi:hypothetical protein